MLGNQLGLKHGHTGRGFRSYTYRSWQAMRQRIRDHRRGYENVVICSRWDSFPTFLEDMGIRPDGMTLDRIDKDGNYEPGNVRWATASEQRQNQHPQTATTVARRAASLRALNFHSNLGQHWVVGPDGKRIYSR